MRQGWRVKRHPLQSADELAQLTLNFSRLPLGGIITRIIDQIEGSGRRIVAIDCDEESMVSDVLQLRTFPILKSVG